jgi:signal transduction histidine kinase
LSNRKWLKLVKVPGIDATQAVSDVVVPRGLGRRFGNLKVRPKLIVLFNLFFLILTAAVYFTVIPPFERRVAAARTIEISLITEIFSGEAPVSRLPRVDAYEYREGTAESLGIPVEIQQWLLSNPGRAREHGDILYGFDPRTGTYRRLALPNLVYDEVIVQAKTNLFLALGVVYVLSVAVLELLILPAYVYQPIRLMLESDAATRANDREHELINPALILGDEIGQIMKSRNQTVQQLRRHEDDLSAALSQLEAQDRLASLGMLSASVAHEMNTPLAVLHGSVEKLLETSADPAARQRLERILRVTTRLRTISEGLVDFARARRDTMEPLPMRGLIDEAWNLVGIDEKAGRVSFRNEVGENATVVGNSDRLIQVFVNLLRNSMQVVPDGGNIWVRSSRFERDGNCWVCTAVEDDGPGIPREVLPDIFDAFVSSRLDARGTGLGLYVAAGIVQQHEGQIHAANRSGGGARLEVVLKAA